MKNLIAARMFPENPVQHLQDVLKKRNPSSVWLLCDRNTRKHCLPLLKEALPSTINIMTLQAGEESKSLASCELIWNSMSRKMQTAMPCSSAWAAE